MSSTRSMLASVKQGYGGFHTDIESLVSEISDSGMFRKNAAATAIVADAVQSLAEQVSEMAYNHYHELVNEKFSQQVATDANGAGQMLRNAIITEQAWKPTEHSGEAINENYLPDYRSLTSTIAVTMRNPYEAKMHRLFDTMVLDTPNPTIETVTRLIRGPADQTDEDLIEALSPRNPNRFIDRTEIKVEELTSGIDMSAVENEQPVKYLQGQNELWTVNTDVRITHIDVTLDGQKIDQKDITFATGSTPYFSKKDNVLNVAFDVKKPDGTVVTMRVRSEIDYAKNELKYISATPGVTKVYFYATVDHRQHTHVIRTSYTNRFDSFIVPTRPHIVVSMTQEDKDDLTRSESFFGKKDPIALLTDNVSLIAPRLEDQRLKKVIESGHSGTARFDFNPPANFVDGPTAWIKREFIPWLDHISLKMKDQWNITDCHFRVGVSPYILRRLDTDYTMDKAASENSRGSGVINYSMGIKTSTSVFYFISSQDFKDDEGYILLIPNNFKMSELKTYVYFKYTSFMTDQLRDPRNTVMPGFTYCERNLPICFTTANTMFTVSGMPTVDATDNQYIYHSATPEI